MKRWSRQITRTLPGLSGEGVAVSPPESGIHIFSFHSWIPLVVVMPTANGPGAAGCVMEHRDWIIMRGEIL